MKELNAFVAAVQADIAKQFGDTFAVQSVTVVAVDAAGIPVVVPFWMPQKTHQMPGKRTLRQMVMDELRKVAKPVKGSLLARKCGRKANPHFYATMAALGREGEVVSSPDGYSLLRKEP